jgi:von Willebrand factor type A C-terminal domain/von Willebrand factor type A domain
VNSRPDVRIDIDQNEYVPEDGRQVHAIVTVDVAFPDRGAGAGSTGAGDAAEVVIIDCSGSMEYPADKIVKAKEATAVAIDVLRDGVVFAVVAGTHTAAMVYPPEPRLVAVDHRTRAEAKAALAGLRPDGGTAIGQWLRQARRLFADHHASIRHAILLTDGKNEHETPEQLAEALSACEGQFTCDCRGVGADWAVNELRMIASALLGTVDIIAEPADLAADFRSLTAAAMDKAVADVYLRLWTPQGARARLVKQVMPTIEDLTDRRVASGPRTGDYPTGSWGAESRAYHICVEVIPAGLGDEMLAARVSLVLASPDGPERVLGQGLVRVLWTDDPALPARINAKVAHYTDQEELAAAIQEGLEARKAGDVGTATEKLGLAVALANKSGHTGTAKLLAKVVDIDPDTGTVRLRATVSLVDEMTLDARSTRTARIRKDL